MVRWFAGAIYMGIQKNRFDHIPIKTPGDFAAKVAHSMEPVDKQQQQQNASAFWRTYFAKFRRRVEDREPSQTQPAPLSGVEPVPLPHPDRRRARAQRAGLPR